MNSNLKTIFFSLLLVSYPFLFSSSANAQVPLPSTSTAPQVDLSITCHPTFQNFDDRPASNAAKQPEAQIQVESKWRAPYPYTADEVQDKLIQVLKVPPDELTKDEIETIFNMKLVNYWDMSADLPSLESKYLGKHTKREKYWSLANVDWYFSLGISIVPNKTYFSFSLWDTTKPLPVPATPPMYIDFQKFVKSVEHANLGWKLVPGRLVSVHGYVDPSQYFTKNGIFSNSESIRVSYLPGTNCMTDIEYSITTQNTD